MSPRTGLIEAFLEMMSAERGAGANTLAAYARDLEDFAAFAKAGVEMAGRDEVQAYLVHLSKVGSRGLVAGAAPLGAPAIFWLPLCRRYPQGQSHRGGDGAQGVAAAAQDSFHRATWKP